MENSEDPRIVVHPSLKIAFALIFGGYFLALIVSSFTPESMSSSFIVLGEMLLIVPSLIYLKQKKYDIKQVFRLNGVHRSVLYLCLPFGAAMAVLSDEIDRIVNTFIQMPPEWQEIIEQSLAADTPLEWLNLFLGAVVLAGIFEEMLFRGMLQKALEAKFDLHRAIFLSAFVFAMIHLPFWLIQVLILGLIFGFIAWRSNSILPTIILHCLNNAIALLSTNSNAANWGWYNWNGHVNPTILVIAIGIFYYSGKGFIKLTEKTRLSPSQAYKKYH